MAKQRVRDQKNLKTKQSKSIAHITYHRKGETFTSLPIWKDCLLKSFWNLTCSVLVNVRPFLMLNVWQQSEPSHQNIETCFVCKTRPISGPNAEISTVYRSWALSGVHLYCRMNGTWMAKWWKEARRHIRRTAGKIAQIPDVWQFPYPIAERHMTGPKYSAYIST